MPELVGNPAVWIIAAISAGGVIFAIGRWVGAVNHDRKSFDAFMKEVRDDIKEILTRLSPPPPVASLSPVQLTDFGKKISATVNASKWAEEQAPDLVEAASGKEEFEVFDICVDHVSKAFEDDPDFQKVVQEPIR